MGRPSIADTPVTVEAIFESLPARLRKDRPRASATYHWTVEGAAAPLWTVELDEDGCRVARGHDGDPDCSVVMDESTFLAIETGRANPMSMYMKGQIQARNVLKLRNYDRAFHRFHDVPQAEDARESG